MPKRHIFDASGGVVSTVEYDPVLKETTIASMQSPKSIEAVLDQNQRFRNDNPRAMSKQLGLRPMASIPRGLAYKWIQEAGIPLGQFFKWPVKAQNEFFRIRYLSSDYNKVRTSEWR